MINQLEYPEMEAEPVKVLQTAYFVRKPTTYLVAASNYSNILREYTSLCAVLFIPYGSEPSYNGSTHTTCVVPFFRQFRSSYEFSS